MVTLLYVRTANTKNTERISGYVSCLNDKRPSAVGMPYILSNTNTTLMQQNSKHIGNGMVLH